MQSTATLLIKLGAISAASSVALGAFGAHGLQKKIQDPKLIKNWETAAYYQMIHSFALIATGLVAKRRHTMIGSLFLGGIVLFSGSLYALVLTQNRKLGAITPIGGVAYIAGWLALAFAAL